MDQLSEKDRVKRRREMIEKEIKIRLPAIASYSFDPQKTVNRNIENMIGAIQVPLGIAGPMKIKSNQSSVYYLPLATTEGALVASVNRGCKAARLAGGVFVLAENAGATRAPVLRVKSLKEGKILIDWVKKNFEKLKKTAKETSSHLELLKIQPTLFGRNVYLRFSFDTGEAMGMNMATKASGKIVALIEEKTKIKCLALSGNLCVDKKLCWQNAILTRGKKAWAEVVLSKKIVKDVLKTTPEKIAEVVYRKCLLGSAITGSLAFNAHFANIVGAIFLATGQDAAHLVEGSLGITTAEVLKNGSLYFSVYLPGLMIGTVGGGTGLATQKEALSILGLGNGEKGEVLKFAEIIAGAVLCGELSLVAALSAGHLVKAHEKLGRGRVNSKFRMQNAKLQCKMQNF